MARIMCPNTITYTGGEMYWIAKYRGTYEVRRETSPCDDRNATVFTGSFDKCKAYLEELKVLNADCDLNL